MQSFNCIISPFDKFWDLSQNANQERWLVALKAAIDHVRFDVSVTTAKQFLELLKDKSEYFQWGLLMHFPIVCAGSFNSTKDKLANGKEMIKLKVTEKVNLLKQWTRVPTAKCQQFAQWYNGGDSLLLTDAFKADPASCKVVALDCNNNTNKGLVRRYKIQLCIVDQLILHVLKNHLALTASTYKSFLALKRDLSLIDKILGNKIHSGLILMRKMLGVFKPKTIVEVCHLARRNLIR
jgi:hypothetical protein